MMVERATTTTLPDISGTRALVYSLGIEGRDLARWLLAHGASVTMADSRTAEQLDAAGATAPEGVERTIRGELLDPKGFDLLAVSQSVLRSHPNVLRARQLAIPVVSQMALALRLCRGRVVGVTGSSGKSTTTALVGAMAETAGIEHLVGGNLGGSLLDRIEAVPETATVILEISHTQLPVHRPLARDRRGHERHAEPPRPVQLARIRRPEAKHPALPGHGRPRDPERRRRHEPGSARRRAGSAGRGLAGRTSRRRRRLARRGRDRFALGRRARDRRHHRRPAHARPSQRRERRHGHRDRAGNGSSERGHRGRAATLPGAAPPPAGCRTGARSHLDQRQHRDLAGADAGSAGGGAGARHPAARRTREGACRWKSCAPPPGSAAAPPSASGKRPRLSRRRWRGPWTRSHA